MTVKFSNPEVERYVAEQVRSGRFPSADALLEEAVGRMMVEQPDELTEADWAAIAEADAEIERGEYEDFDVVAARLMAKVRGAKEQNG